jgi:TetR/AcrR family transcriptional repressor of nem operon
MARPKEFDRDEALHKAMEVFWRSGYERTSVDDLLRGMQIGRQSLYDTFGGKHPLFVEALDRYRRRYAEVLGRKLGESPSPLAAVRALFHAIADEPGAQKARGCLLINAVVELAPRDEAIARLVADNQRVLRDTLEGALVRAARLGELPADVDAAGLASYLVASMQGLRLAAKADPDPARLHHIAEQMLKALG